MHEPDQPSPALRSPPFTGMRAVEAAVRNKSYSAAARELSITHAAISQAIKKLEAELGLKLFERNGQMMEPSDSALHLARAYSEAQATLYRSLGDVMERAAPATRVVIAMPPGFARFWFGPRIGSLSEAMPKLKIEIRTAAQDEAAGDGSDVHLGEAPVDGADWAFARVAGIDLFPVCSTDFQSRHGSVGAKTLSGLPLLAEKRWPWSVWFDAVGPGGRRRISQDLLFDDPQVTLDAAARGHGVMLTHIFHAEDYLRRGLLVAPVGQTVATGESLYLSWRKTGGEGVSRVAAWLNRSLHGSADEARGLGGVR